MYVDMLFFRVYNRRCAILPTDEEGRFYGAEDNEMYLN